MVITNPKVHVLLTKIVKHHPVSICSDDDGKIYIDLETQMKSHAYMYIHDDYLEIQKRYGESTKIDLNQDIESIWSDLISCVESCRYGREYIAYGWARILEEFYG